MKNFEASPITIKDFLNQKDVVFRVPPYQRPYSWESEQTLSFWEDLNDFNEVSFLGSFVVNNEDKKNGFIDLIDGQQRIITITVMLSILRDSFKKQGYREKADGVHRSYISNKDDDGKDSYKLKVGKNLENFFIQLIQQEENDLELIPRTEEEKLLKKNHKILKDKLSEQIKKEKNIEKYLTKLRDKIKEFQIIFVEVEKEEDAFTFFETLNARGLELSTADVLKNLIFKKLNKKEDINKLQDIWQNIMDNLTDGNEEIDASKFIRHYWLSKNKFITQKKLFRSVKSLVKNYSDFLKDLEKESELYRKINFPTREEWKGNYIDIWKSLENLKKMKTSQSNSILLSLMRIIHRSNYSRYKTKKIKLAFSWIEYFTFNFSIIAKKSPAPLERLYSKHAIILDKCKNKEELEKGLENLKKDLKDYSPKRDSFLEGFKNLKYSKKRGPQSIIRYVLEKINYNGNSEQVFDNVNIEHIIPQNPKTDSRYKKDKIKEYVDNIGNLIPLGPEYNKEASNRDPIDKINYYKKSEINIVSDVVKRLEKNKDWGEHDIEDRSIDLSQKAWQIWNIDNLK